MVRCVLPLALFNVATALRGGRHSGRHLQLEGSAVVLPEIYDQMLLSPKYSPVESPVYIQPHDSTPGGEQAKFEKECHSYLLSKYATDDELISQHDFADFLTEYCRWEGVCEKGERLKFEMLPSPIQIAFADPLCEGETMCIEKSDENFGYVYKKGFYDETETQIAGLCETMYPLVGQYVSNVSGEQWQFLSGSPLHSKGIHHVFS